MEMVMLDTQMGLDPGSEAKLTLSQGESLRESLRLSEELMEAERISDQCWTDSEKSIRGGEAGMKVCLILKDDGLVVECREIQPGVTLQEAFLVGKRILLSFAKKNGHQEFTLDVKISKVE